MRGELYLFVERAGTTDGLKVYLCVNGQRE